jgi:hypothetical protein
MNFYPLKLPPAKTLLRGQVKRFYLMIQSESRPESTDFTVNRTSAIEALLHQQQHAPVTTEKEESFRSIN